MKRHFLLLLLGSLLALLPLAAQDESSGEPVGIRVGAKNTFALPVDQLNIRPHVGGFTISFTLDFADLENDTTTTLLSFRSREWDGTPNEEKGTFWIGRKHRYYIDDSIKIQVKQYRSLNKTYDQNAHFTVKNDGGIHNITLVCAMKSQYYVSITGKPEFEKVNSERESIRIYFDGKLACSLDAPGLHGNYIWRESAYFLIGDSVFNTQTCNAKLYDFKYFARPLNGNQVAKLYDKKISEMEELSCEGYWDFSSGSFSPTSQGSDKNLRAMLVDYRADSLIVPKHERPAKFSQPFSLDSINIVYLHRGAGNLDYLTKDTVEVTLEGDSVKIYVGENSGALSTFPFVIRYSPDNSKMYYNGELYYDFDWEVGDTVRTTLCPGAVVIDKFYTDDTLNLVFSTHPHYPFLAAVHDFEGRHLKDYMTVSLDFGEFLQLTDNGIGTPFLLNGYKGDRIMFRAIKHGSAVTWRHPALTNDYAAFGTGWYGAGLESTPYEKRYILAPSTVTDQLTVSRTDGGEVDLSKVRIHATHGGIVSPASVNGNVMNVDNLPNGVYLLVLTDAEGTHVMKFIKE